MIESYENALQIAVLLVCLCFSVVRAARTREKAWILLSFLYGVLLLGDLYWEAYLIFLGVTPSFYVSEFSWYASYLFLFLLLRQTMPPEAWRKRSALPWIGPVFAVGMCAFYMQWGDVAGNLICALLMGLLLFHSILGLLWLRESQDKRQRRLCSAVLFLCAMEYLTWTLSCYFRDNSFANPYYWSDLLLSLSFALLLPGVRKAVAA